MKGFDAEGIYTVIRCADGVLVVCVRGCARKLLVFLRRVRNVGAQVVAGNCSTESRSVCKAWELREGGDWTVTSPAVLRDKYLRLSWVASST